MKQLKCQQWINTVQQSHGRYNTAAHMDRPQVYTVTGQTSQRNTEQGSHTHKQDALCHLYDKLCIYIIT